MEITNTFQTRSLYKAPLYPKPPAASNYICPRLPDESVRSPDHECQNLNIDPTKGRKSQSLTPSNGTMSHENRHDVRSLGRGSHQLPTTSPSDKFGTLLYNGIDAGKKMAELKPSDYRHARKSSSVPRLAGNTAQKVLSTPKTMQDLFITKENITGHLKNTPLVNDSFDLWPGSKISNSEKYSNLNFENPSFIPKSRDKILE